jgi:hypothetical protein
MDIRRRQQCISGKFKNYAEVVASLRVSRIGYQLGFGLLLPTLLAVLLLDMMARNY